MIKRLGLGIPTHDIAYEGITVMFYYQREGEDEQLSTNFNNIIENVYDYAMSSESQQMKTTKGTVFGAFNSITGYYQNVRNFKDEEVKFKSIMSGTAMNRMQSAFNLCTDFAKVGNSAIFN